MTTPADIFARTRAPGADLLRKILNRQKGECTWCGKPVGRGRRTWCSDSCVTTYRENCDPGYQRRRVEERDKGVCAICGRDTAHWARVANRAFGRRNYAAGRWRGYWWRDGKQYPIRPGRKNKRRQERLWRHRNRIKEAAKWEMHHLVEVVNGGAMLGLDNLITCCLDCHKRETARLAGERAKNRRPQ